MKSHYTRIDEGHRWHWSEKNLGRYTVEYSYWTQVRTTNERRQNSAAKADGIKVRGKRRKLPTSWDDKRISRDWGRSWKDYTKRRKQYHPAVL